MDLELRVVGERAEALALTDLLEEGASESMRALGEPTPPAGSAKRFVDAHFECPETVLVVAHPSGESSVWAFCLTGPLADPWSERRRPLVLALWVAPKIRRRGVARALVQEVTHALGSRGFGTIAARAAHNDDALLSMGERWGFVRTWALFEREE